VFVASGIQNAMRMHDIVMCSPTNSIIFSTLTQTAKFSGKKVIEHKMCFGFLYKFVSF